MPHILEQCPIEYCELAAGDALIFHCNAIHRSDANRSANRRWTLLICYNRVDNDTIIKTDDRYYVPLETVDDGAIRRAGLRFASGDNPEHFASPALRAGPAQGVLINPLESVSSLPEHSAPSSTARLFRLDTTLDAAQQQRPQALLK